jgi:hypothetical protein
MITFVVGSGLMLPLTPTTGPDGGPLPVVITEMGSAPKRLSRGKRAHGADGTFKADDPATPDVDEAWEGNAEA